MGLLFKFQQLTSKKAVTNASTAYQKGIHQGNAGGLVAVEPNLIAANIRYGRTMFGILGTMVQWIYDLKGETGKPDNLILPISALPSVIAPVVVENHSGGGFTATPPTLTVPAIPSLTLSVPVPTSNAFGGALQNDDGVGYTDYTAATNNATANDMLIFPAVSAVNDSFLFGYSALWDFICLNIGTAGTGTYTISPQYSKGGGNWGDLTVINNEIGNMQATGKKWMTWNRPGDWATDTFLGIGPLYWIQFKLTLQTSMTVNPLGTQAWAGVRT